MGNCCTELYEPLLGELQALVEDYSNDRQRVSRPPWNMLCPPLPMSACACHAMACGTTVTILHLGSDKSKCAACDVPSSLVVRALT